MHYAVRDRQTRLKMRDRPLGADADPSRRACTDVRVTQDVNDKFQLLPGMEGVESRCQQRPKEVVADGDYQSFRDPNGGT